MPVWWQQGRIYPRNELRVLQLTPKRLAASRATIPWPAPPT
eukprot:COSAG01_NODE_64149_length_277_cov_1.168539_1_plen_40_part_10